MEPTTRRQRPVGAGDVGKSTVLDAIDYCLGARRALTFSDVDFHDLDETQPIRIAVTVSDLPTTLLDLDAYGLYLRGFDPTSSTLVDEPGQGLETAVTIALHVDSSLEPTWSLFSERAAASGQQRTLGWAQRMQLAPARLGPGATFHLAWRQGSLLSRLTNELPNASQLLADAARQARRAFGEHTGDELQKTLDDIGGAASALGINVEDGLTAMLDAESVSIGRGTIALHTKKRVPLHCLGTGSLRLLVAVLQQRANNTPSIVLVDEVEHGLEPHRISRLLVALGAKDPERGSQVFLTTHSPVAVRELSADALYVLRSGGNGAVAHDCIHVGAATDVQGTVRRFPEALLGKVIIVCEGASEVGLLRGLNQYDDDNGRPTLASKGVIPIDGGGKDSVVGRARSLQSLGFQTAILRDSDIPTAPSGEGAYLAAGGRVFVWTTGRALEDELFLELPDNYVHQLLKLAEQKVGTPTLEDHIKSASDGKTTLADCQAKLTPNIRAVLSKAAKSKNGTWFKTVSEMELVGREVVGPALGTLGGSLGKTIGELQAWAVAAS